MKCSISQVSVATPPWPGMTMSRCHIGVTPAIVPRDTDCYNSLCHNRMIELQQCKLVRLHLFTQPLRMTQISQWLPRRVFCGTPKFQCPQAQCTWPAGGSHTSRCPWAPWRRRRWSLPPPGPSPRLLQRPHREDREYIQQCTRCHKQPRELWLRPRLLDTENIQDIGNFR